MDHPKPELKYMSAKDLKGTGTTLAGAPVIGSDGENLGEVEGFIVDVRKGVPRHVVVGAGWFIHKHFLLPMGNVNLQNGESKLLADITKQKVEGFPGFDKGEFEKLGKSRAFDMDDVIFAGTDKEQFLDRDSFYRVPVGWDAGPQ